MSTIQHPGKGRLAETRDFQGSREAVPGDGLIHLLDRHRALLVRDDGLAVLETHLGLPDSLEPLQGSLDQDRSPASGHALNPEMDDCQLLRLARHGPERQPKTWETSKKAPAIHKNPSSATCARWHPHRGPGCCAATTCGPEQQVG